MWIQLMVQTPLNTGQPQTGKQINTLDNESFVSRAKFEKF